jgi:DedD protein
MAKNPEEQNIKSRARRRLIGAVALALAVVVILPMVLDSEPKPTGQDIDLRIPASDKVGEFVPGTALSEVVAAAQLAESAVAASAAAPAETATDEIAKFADTSPEVTTKALAEVRQGEVKKPEVKPVDVKNTEARPAEMKKPEAKKSEAKPVDVKKPDVKKPEIKQSDAKSQATITVQVGAFSNAETALQEANKLKAWGFKAYTEFVGGTTRVRVGPYVERSKAEEVRSLLEKRGLHPVIAVVKP